MGAVVDSKFRPVVVLGLNGGNVVDIPMSSVVLNKPGCKVVDNVLGTNVLVSGAFVVVYTGLTPNGVVGFELTDVVLGFEEIRTLDVTPDITGVFKLLGFWPVACKRACNSLVSSWNCFISSSIDCVVDGLVIVVGKVVVERVVVVTVGCGVVLILFKSGIFKLLGFCPVTCNKALSNLVSSWNCLISSSMERVVVVCALAVTGAVFPL